MRVAGNHRLYRADPVRLDELRAALDAFWGERLVFVAQLATAAEGGRA